MLNLNTCLKSIGSESFTSEIKQALQGLPAGSLPLHQALNQGGYVNDENISVTVLNIVDKPQHIEIKIGVFFTEIVICCGCGDDPMPVNAYAELRLSMDRQTGNTDIEILKD